MQQPQRYELVNLPVLVELAKAVLTLGSTTEIIAFRDGAWDPIHARSHRVHHTYRSETDENDFMVSGRVTFVHKNGKSVSQSFVGNFLFVETEKSLLIQRYEAWLVSIYRPWNEQNLIKG